MIHITENFFNKVATEVRSRYFANENHSTTENKDYHLASNTIELFNNGCLTYRQLIGRLAKSCQTNNATIHNLVEKHIVSFGTYRYKPRKLYSENKVLTNKH